MSRRWSGRALEREGSGSGRRRRSATSSDSGGGGAAKRVAYPEAEDACISGDGDGDAAATTAAHDPPSPPHTWRGWHDPRRIAAEPQRKAVTMLRFNRRGFLHACRSEKDLSSEAEMVTGFMSAQVESVARI
eukprot:gene9400-49227_t